MMCHVDHAGQVTCCWGRQVAGNLRHCRHWHGMQGVDLGEDGALMRQRERV
jgi:hypothetical protein